METNKKIISYTEARNIEMMKACITLKHFTKLENSQMHGIF